MAGRKIGPYQVIDEIGSGGMALVYKAEQTSLGRMVAIKELRTEFARDRGIVTRFEREARTIAALGHQNIVHVYDFLTRGTSMYIVMEYVEGTDLYDLMSKVERLPPDVAAIIGLQAARALEYAHFHGVVHRDFKPSNLMITKQGEVKLMDFGIARDESEKDLTRPGIALGTPSYMSPEQVMGEKVNFSSDIFSFGIVLYQLVTGQKPFVDDETVSVMNRIVNETYNRPRSLYPDIPRKLQGIIKKCLRKNPQERYSSTERLRRDLEDYVAKNVPINYNGRLLIYLRNRGLVTDDEAKTYVAEADLRSLASLEVDSGKVSTWQVVLRPLLGLNLIALVAFALFAAILQFSNVGSTFAQLHVNVRPWADVYVDGLHVITTPHAGALRLTPGEHKIEFRNNKYHSVVRDVTLKAGETERLHVELKRKR